MSTFTRIARKVTITFLPENKKLSSIVRHLSFALIFLISSIQVFSQAADGDYRSATGGTRGTWQDSTSWQRYNGSGWVQAPSAPSSSDGVITILSGDSIFINLSTIIDQTIVEAGGYLEVDNGAVTVEDGPGTDLLLNSPNAMVWANGPVLSVSSGALISGSTANIFYRGASMLNNGTIDINNFDMSPDPGHQIINGVGTFSTLTIRNSADVTLGGNQTITNSLFFSFGKIITGANKLILNDGVSVINANNGNYVNGNVEWQIVNPGARDFPIGDNTTYAPVTLDPSFTGTGAIQARTDPGDHPNIAASGIDASQSINRTWTLTNNGLAFTECDATFNWSQTDKDPGTDSTRYTLAKLEGGVWTLPASTIPHSTSLYVGNLTSLGEFQIGDPVSLSINCPVDITVCQDAPSGAAGVLFYPKPITTAVAINYADRILNYSNVSINGGTNQAVVAPGSVVNLGYDLSVFYGGGYCPGCVVQTSIGIGSTFQTLHCDTSISSGYTVSPSLSFTAPTTPGIYYLTEESSLDYFCQEFKYNNDSARAIAVLVVGSPAPTVSGGFGSLTVTNNAPAVFPIGTTPVTWTVTDANGNTATCSQNITVAAATVYYRDRDGDGYGNPLYPVYACTQPTGFILENTDCDDYQAGVHTGCPSNAGAALNFDGVDDKIVVTNGVDLSQKSFSVEMWLKKNANADYDVAFAQGPNFGQNKTLHIGFSPGGNTFFFNFYQNDLNIAVTPDLNWHHWACTFDNVTKARKIYRDGVLIGSDISPSTFLGDGSSAMYIGDNAYGTNSFDGNIDELRVWTRTLSQAEIQRNMNCEITAQAGLGAAYHFNQDKPVVITLQILYLLMQLEQTMERSTILH